MAYALSHNFGCVVYILVLSFLLLVPLEFTVWYTVSFFTCSFAYISFVFLPFLHVGENHAVGLEYPLVSDVFWYAPCLLDAHVCTDVQCLDFAHLGVFCVAI